MARTRRPAPRLSVLVAIAVAGLLWLTSNPAGATDNPDYTAPPPTTVVTTPPPTTPTKVKTAVAVAPLRTSLAITGSDATGTVVLGAGLVLAGAGVLVLRRRRTLA